MTISIHANIILMCQALFGYKTPNYSDFGRIATDVVTVYLQSSVNFCSNVNIETISSELNKLCFRYTRVVIETLELKKNFKII